MLQNKYLPKQWQNRISKFNEIVVRPRQCPRLFVEQMLESGHVCHFTAILRDREFSHSINFQKYRCYEEIRGLLILRLPDLADLLHNTNLIYTVSLINKYIAIWKCYLVNSDFAKLPHFIGIIHEALHSIKITSHYVNMWTVLT